MDRLPQGTCVQEARLLLRAPAGRIYPGMGNQEGRMDSSAVPISYVLAGIALILTAILPRLLSRGAMTPAMVFVGAGALASLVPGARPAHPLEHLPLVEHLTEVCVIVALMGVGLALDRPVSLRGWSSTWRLLGVAMPLFIGAVALGAHVLLGLAAPAALLLGAALAPTDPVLASDVRVGEPTDDPSSEDDLRFALSSEAGLNDGLAFPFVSAAILLLAAPAVDWAGGWVLWDALGKVAVGTACGVAIGYSFAHLAFRAPALVLRFADTAEAVVALAAVFLAYGVAELLHGYGFLSVFVAALALRAQERGHHFHRTLHEFITQIERLLTMGLLLLFGFSLPSLLSGLTWQALALALAAVVLVRPLVGGIAMLRSPVPVADRRSIAFFGVKGIGSFYYLAYATSRGDFGEEGLLWSVVSMTVIVSVVVHGTTASPVLRRLDRRFGRRTPDPV